MNDEIKQIDLVTKRSMAEGVLLVEGRTQTGLLLRAMAHPGGGGNFDKIFERMEFSLNNLYQDQLAPYPGQITKSVSCPSRFRPRALPGKEDSSARGKGFLLKANAREVFGACDLGSVHFQAAYILIGCKAKNVAYEIKMFLPDGEAAAAELTQIYERFSCK